VRPDDVRDLVDRIRAGDGGAFEALFRAHYGPLCGFATRYVRDPALAEELVQDLFADLWAKRRAWEPRTSVRAYLFAAVRNRALNLRARQAVESDWLDRETVAEVRTLHHEPPPADEVLASAELHARLDAALESLPERCRLVMRLRWREQLGYAEIAEIMGISAKGVENQLSRGLKMLRGVLKDRG